MKIDNPMYYEDSNWKSNEQHHEDSSFSLVWRPLLARFFPDTEMIYWVPEYMDTLRSRKKGKEKQDDDAYDSSEICRSAKLDKPDLNFNYDQQYNDHRAIENIYHSPVGQVLNQSSKKLTMLSPLKKIPQLLSPRCAKALNNSESQLIPESPESQKITITFSPESLMDGEYTNDQFKISDFRSPAAAHKLHEASPNFYLMDKAPTENNSKSFFGRRFDLSHRQNRVLSDVTDDFVFHRPNVNHEYATNSPSYINPLELQRINHRQSGDPLPTPPTLSPWEPYGNSGHIYMNNTQVLKGRIPEPKVLDGFLTSSLDQNLHTAQHRNCDYEPVGMKVLSNSIANSAIQQAYQEAADNIYRLNLRLFSCMVLLILILGVVLILVILRVPVL